jgi:hypothetical protein
MGFLHVVTDGPHVYAVRDNGDLLYSRFEDPKGDGSGTFVVNAQRIATGWESYRHVVPGGDGILYAVAANGDVLFFQDRDHKGKWANDGPRKIATGWANFATIVGGDDGILYAIAPDGKLFFYQDLARNGEWNWAHAGIVIGSGWNEYLEVVSGGGGVLYARRKDGALLFFKDEARDGTARWTEAKTPLGTGWDSYAAVRSGGNGVLYALSPNGHMLWHRDLAQDGTSSWAKSSGRQIGSGWLLVKEPPSGIQGYCVPYRASPGEKVRFSTSAKAPFAVTYYRLKFGAYGELGNPVAPTFEIPATGPRRYPADAYSQGCGWPVDFELTVNARWKSGIYAAECVNTADQTARSYIVFVVRPDAATDVRAEFAVLANTNTWAAYNDFGGRSQYTKPNAALLSFERPHPNTSPMATSYNHLVRAEVEVLSWLEDSHFTCDVYADLDMHRGEIPLTKYKGLILSTHPEYWTDAMRDNLEEYLESGGRVVYLGGNALYERVAFDPSGKLIFRGGVASRERNLFRAPTDGAAKRPERALLGVAYEDPNYLTFAPYKVKIPGHPLFDGLELKQDSLLGTAGPYGAGGASGWEMDSASGSGAIEGVTVLASGLNVGTNGKAYGADMAYLKTASGGFVFSVGSLAFGASLVREEPLQKIVRNALEACRAGKSF